jgi:glycosyltransferase involved in cell wall biosynthesis
MRSQSHLVLIPGYNPGSRLKDTVAAALSHWSPVWVVVDGSTDGSHHELEGGPINGEGLKIILLPANRGKGHAVLHGMRAALTSGFTHALVMDADGQHAAKDIARFMQVSASYPEAMILGSPQFGPEAPASRRFGRQFGNWWTHLETLWGGVGDSLFGFRVYPLTPAVSVLDSTSTGRGYDFETVLAVRLFWAGVRPINLHTRVQYFSRAQGGVSHFRYVRHNLLLLARHTALVLEMFPRLPQILRARRAARNHSHDDITPCSTATGSRTTSECSSPNHPRSEPRIG